MQIYAPACGGGAGSEEELESAAPHKFQVKASGGEVEAFPSRN